MNTRAVSGRVEPLRWQSFDWGADIAARRSARTPLRYAAARRGC